ncbi:hypothetical protein HN011_005745 [Eciton burchellii]|nr:hypothetical protein HN011_005745 [Eciton burchellii]
MLLLGLYSQLLCTRFQLIILVKLPEDECLPVHSPPCLGGVLSITLFNRDFNNECFKSDGKLIYRLNSQSRESVLLLVWFFTFDLSGKEDSTSNYATTGIAIKILRTHKALHLMDTFGKMEALRRNTMLLLLIQSTARFCLFFSSTKSGCDQSR